MLIVIVAAYYAGKYSARKPKPKPKKRRKLLGRPQSQTFGQWVKRLMFGS